ncbi:MAG: hypothetical protein MI919_38685, partial [Holophagales bacterium]|nr:hypothetical protein [Holophagales bacterium]
VEWQWDGHHNTFTLAAGHEVELGGRPDFEILARRDVTPLVNQGGGELELTVEKAGYARWLGTYLDGRASDDEVRLFQDMGRPDRISLDPREPGESAWWYFSIGKVYRFADGALDQVTHFEPVAPLPSDPR